MAKVVLDLSYSDKDKDIYDKFILKLESEGWEIENTFIDQRKGRGKYYYRTMLRHIVDETDCGHENTEILNGLQHCLDCGGVRDLNEKGQKVQKN